MHRPRVGSRSAFRQANAAGGQAKCAASSAGFPPAASGHRRGFTRASLLHALPKTILRRGRKPAGAILGFANMLLRLYRDERLALCLWRGTR